VGVVVRLPVMVMIVRVPVICVVPVKSTHRRPPGSVSTRRVERRST
jgi:hypothetical protein